MPSLCFNFVVIRSDHVHPNVYPNTRIKSDKGLPGFFHTFIMALYHKWNVKNVFAYVLTFFSLCSDGLGGLISKQTTIRNFRKAYISNFPFPESRQPLCQ